MSEKIYGFLILPYQYLQIIGYRLAGIPCRYEFGTFGVEPLTQPTRPQRWLSKLLPLLVVGIGWIVQIAITVYLARQYQASLPFIPLLFVLCSTPVLAFYTHFIRFDLKQNRVSMGHSSTSQGRQN